MAPSDQIRLLVVEDVPQVAQYIRNLLNAQAVVKLLDVVGDGSHVAADVAELRPDLIVVDALLQGKVKAPAVLDQLHKSGISLPVILLTVPQTPIKADSSRGIHGVLTMPFSGYDFLTMIQQVRADFEAGSGEPTSQLVAIFGPKGGTGRTTIAFNLAVALGQLGRRTVLIDGNFQFADLRGLLKVPAGAPSILDLPTDRVSQSDLDEVLWRDPSGIDILMAPPRVEMADMLTARDVEKVLSMLRRVYPMIIVDLSPAINEINLVILDQATSILEVLTAEPAVARSADALAATFEAIGYPDEKVLYVVNRLDEAGSASLAAIEQALGRPPERRIPFDPRVVAGSNMEGLPFVLAQPDAAVSREVRALAAQLVARPVAPAAAARR